MKKLLSSTLIIIAVNIGVCAQESNNTAFILKDFAEAKVFLKNNSLTVSPMNYDAVKKRMCFKQDEIIMELTNVLDIDSIIWIDKSVKFITQGKSFLEEINLSHGTIYIDWRIKNVYVGARGAFGVTSQANIDAVSLESIGIYNLNDNKNHTDIYQHKNDNSYYIPIDGVLHKIKTLKHLVKLYPSYKENIEIYAKEESIDMKNTTSVLKVLDYCLSLAISSTR